MPWYGPGPSPAEAWPGVTIDIPVVWSTKNRRWESHDGRYYFDEAFADKACNFFPTFLRHHIGEFAGQDFDLLDYQRKLLTRPIFGWKHTATGLRRFRNRQPLLILITHAGDDDEGICYEEYEYAKRVLSGSLDDEQCLPVIFEAQPEEDWQSPAVWQRVNPGHGETVKPEAIEAEAREATAEPRKRNDFLRFHLNRWVNQATAWIPVDWWDACRGDQLDEAHLQTAVLRRSGPGPEVGPSVVDTCLSRV